MAEKEAPSLNQQIKAKQAAIAVNRKARAEELQLLEKEQKLLAEIEGKELDRAKLSEDQAKLKQSFLEEAQRLLRETLRLQIEAGHKVTATVDALKDKNVEIARGAAELDKQNESLKKQEEYLNDVQKLANSTAAGFENMARQMHVLESETNAFLVPFKNFSKILEKSVKDGKGLKAGLTDAFKGVGKGAAGAAKQVFSISNVFSVLAQNTFELAGEMNQGNKALVAYGFSADKSKEIINSLSPAFIKAGGSVGEFTQAIEGLNAASPKLSKALGKEFVGDLALMAKAGLNTADSAKIFQQALIQQGKSADVAKDLLGDLVAVSRSLGEPAGKAAKQYAQFGKQLRAFGPDAIKVFKRLKEVSHDSGVEMEKLLGIASGFQTFEEAATATQSLNLVLGSQISSVEMLNARDDEKIAIIQKAIRAYGPLTSLTQHQTRLLEEALPGNLELSEIMGLSNKVSVEAADTTVDHSNTLKDLTKDMSKVRTGPEAVADSMKSGMTESAKAMNNLNMEMGELVNAIDTGAAMIGFVMLGLIGSAVSLAFTLGSIGPAGVTAAGGLAAAATAGVPALAALGTASAVAVKPVGLLALALLGVGGAFALIGVGVLMAGKGIKEIGESFAIVGNSIGKLIEASKSLTWKNMGGFARFATNLAESVAAINTVKLDSVRALKDTLNAAVSLSVSNTATSNNNKNAPAAAANTAATNSSKIINNSSKIINVSLMLDGKVLDNKILDVVTGALSS